MRGWHDTRLETPAFSGQINPMTGYAFTLGGAHLVALPSGALYWPDKGLLAVSDLHFGKSERLARRGGALLPPYETRATLARLATDLNAMNALHVLCLGDSFDDLAAASALAAADQHMLAQLMENRRWSWLEGNHDPATPAVAGDHLTDLFLAPLAFRHIGGGGGYEISGHYHPKARLAGRSHRCFLIDSQRVILPAYGAYTGGLWTHDPGLAGAMLPNALAVLTGAKALAIPMPR